MILKDNFESGLAKGYEYVHKGYVALIDADICNDTYFSQIKWSRKETCHDFI